MWSIAKALQVPIDSSIKEIRDIPYTISYIIRKRLQVDNLSELPKDKRPPDAIIWDGSPEELDDWLDSVFKTKEKESVVVINSSEIEG